MAQSTRTAANPPALANHVAGTLAYLTVIPAIVFLLVDPYQHNRFVRFHAWQCIFLTVSWCAVELVMAGIAFVDPVAGPLLEGVDSFFSLAVLVIWLMLMIKTMNRGCYKLPLIGDWAERRANL